jgi:hypothetical protein
MGLSKYSTDALEGEIWRRKQMNLPTEIRPHCFQGLVEAVRETVQTLAVAGTPPKDCEHWIFEAALECMYGSGIWPWWEGKCND